MFQIIESITAPIKRLFPTIPNHARHIPIVEMIAIKTRSPREVIMGKNPFRLISGKNDGRSQKIVEMLNLLGLQKRKNHYPNEISGGERQRIAVMRALVNSPSIVIADEPTGNLDSENSQLLLKLLVSLRTKYKQSFIIATHDFR